MDQSVIEAYAPKARREFFNAIKARAAHFGVSESSVEPTKIEGDFVIIMGRAFHKGINDKRAKLIARIEREGFEHVIAAISYTWFNRFVAIRYMEIHGYFEHGYRVLSHPDGNSIPEILQYADRINLKGLNLQKVLELKLDGTKDAEIYQMLIIAQCNDLNYSMPFLFENVDDESELLLPENLLNSDSLVRELVKSIPEIEWQQVEIIGWLYQFYISEKKAEVIGKVVKPEDIPAATQLFTPNWLVQYMVQNSLGAQWLATYPNSGLKAKMPYYIEPAKQSNDVVVKLREMTPLELNPEELTFMDPASGSGHILVEAYDLFKQIYIERGYRLKDIPRLILEKNLYGLDIDDRAAQLTALSVLMKARADDRNIFKSTPSLNIAAIQETIDFDADEMADLLFDSKAGFTKEDVKKLILLFGNAKTFGSLITLPDEILRKIPKLKELVTQPPKDMLASVVIAKIKPIVIQAELLAKKYDVVVANPPYLNTKHMTPEMKGFMKLHFKQGEKDLFAGFMLRAEAWMKSKSSMSAFTTSFSWMSLSSFEELRKLILDTKTINSLVELETNAFEPAMVTVCSFVLSHTNLPYFKGCYVRLSDFKGAKNQPIRTLEAIGNRSCGWFFESNQNDFKKAPGSPISYMVKPSVMEVFERSTILKNIGDTRQGMATSDNNRFIRRWFECNFQKINLNANSREDAKNSKLKWFPYNKGGDFRKWYGNQEYVVNWENDGQELLGYASSLYGSPTRTIKSISEYFKPSLSWSKISSSNFSVRFFPAGFIFDVAGCSIFFENTNQKLFVCGFLNSPIASAILEALAPTLNFEAGTIALLPIINNWSSVSIEPVQKLIDLAKEDWDTQECSWSFKRNPLISLGTNTIKESCITWLKNCNELVEKVRDLEQLNNSNFIKAYGLAGELENQVKLEEISLLANFQNRNGIEKSESELVDIVAEASCKSLVSYAVGCMMGRYSLDQEGIVYANSDSHGFNPDLYKTFPADIDGIIPVTGQPWFDDDAANRFKQFIGVAWPKKHLAENLKFVTDTLTDKVFEAGEEDIRKYLSNNFFKNHLLTYRKRPIYWLFSSGKFKAFQAIVYIHRYNDGTLARMRTEYVIPLQGKMNALILQLEADIAASSSSVHQKKLVKEQDLLKKQRIELQEFDEKLRHYADMRIKLDLDDGVKVNYGKFGDLLAEVKTVTGGAED